jgi:hypothetical protein
MSAGSARRSRASENSVDAIAITAAAANTAASSAAVNLTGNNVSRRITA